MYCWLWSGSLKYKENSFVNALQWVIGLEIFLTCRRPMAGCFDNGSSERWSFYILSSFDKTLMNKEFRDEQLHQLHPDVIEHCILKDIKKSFHYMKLQ